jgi:hypothetical protein
VTKGNIISGIKHKDHHGLDFRQQWVTAALVPRGKTTDAGEDNRKEQAMHGESWG